MAKFSTGLRDYALSTGSVNAALTGGFIHYYSGAAPATADDAVTGTLLCTISVGATGTGLTFEAAASGVLSKATAEVWEGVNAATGTAGYARFVAAADTGTSSTTAPRIQMSVGVSSGDLLMANTLMTSGQTFPLNYFDITLPTL